MEDADCVSVGKRGVNDEMNNGWSVVHPGSMSHCQCKYTPLLFRKTVKPSAIKFTMYVNKYVNI